MSVRVRNNLFRLIELQAASMLCSARPRKKRKTSVRRARAVLQGEKRQRIQAGSRRRQKLRQLPLVLVQEVKQTWISGESAQLAKSTGRLKASMSLMGVAKIATTTSEA